MMQINIEKQSPAILEKTADGFFADFALAAFGRLAYEIEADEPCKVEMAIGEVLAAPGKIEREPGGYRCIKVAEVELQKGVNRGFMFIKKHRSPYQDDYQRSKVLTPENAGGEIAPFRYAEVKGKVKSVKFTRHALFAPFDDDAAQFSCADCHMAKEDGYTSHYWVSPLESETIAASCVACHADLKGFVEGIQAKAEERTIAIGTKLETLTNKLADAVAAGSYTEEELEAIRSLNRKGQFYWDFVFVENSEGAHNSRLTTECLDKAEALIDEALTLIKL